MDCPDKQIREQFLETDLDKHRFIVILAGPGSGKTSLILQKITKLSAKTENWLYLVYNVAARENALQRLEGLVKSKSLAYKVLTFHAYIWKLVKKSFPEKILIPISDANKTDNFSLDSNKEFLTYETLLEFFLERFEQFRDALDFEYLFVDEMQDLDNLQIKILEKFLENGKSLVLVGDLNQSIYSFRNVDIAQIKNFTDRAQVFKLSSNFRSCPHIVNLVNSIFDTNFIYCNKDQKNKDNKVPLLEFKTSRQEASYLAHFVHDLIVGQDTAVSYIKDFKTLTYALGLEQQDSSFAWGDIAFITRQNSYFKYLIDEFQKLGIPYFQIGKVSICWENLTIFLNLLFLQKSFNYQILRTESEWLTFSLKVLCFLHSNNFCNQKIKDKEYHSLLFKFLEQESSLFSALDLKLTEGLDSSLANICTSSEDISVLKGSVPELQVFWEYAQKQGYNRQHLERIQKQGSNKIDFQIWLMQVSQFNSLYKSDFFAKQIDKVRLATIHSSKGLEFRLVLLIGMEDKELPYKHAKNISEEKRLFYVATSRAIEYLVISYSGDKPSRFLAGKPVVLVKPEIKTKRKKSSQLSLLNF